ncbi:hypothetical protein G7046_g3688 [Stylonectria norvegica]|nr:hypothetical protein G7046_g3688 [Stylonectria norvegica]
MDDGSQSPYDSQKKSQRQKPAPASPSDANGHGNSNSNNSLSAKKRKKDGLKPIITMEGASPQPAGEQLAETQSQQMQMQKRNEDRDRGSSSNSTGWAYKQHDLCMGWALAGAWLGSASIKLLGTLLITGVQLCCATGGAGASALLLLRCFYSASALLLPCFSAFPSSFPDAWFLGLTILVSAAPFCHGHLQAYHSLLPLPLPLLLPSAIIHNVSPTLPPLPSASLLCRPLLFSPFLYYCIFLCLHILHLLYRIFSASARAYSHAVRPTPRRHCPVAAPVPASRAAAAAATASAASSSLRFSLTITSSFFALVL